MGASLGAGDCRGRRVVIWSVAWPSTRLSRYGRRLPGPTSLRNGHLRTEDPHEELGRVAQKRSQDRETKGAKTAFGEDGRSVPPSVSS